MRYIIAFLCGFIFLSPGLADNQCTDITNVSQCNNIAGCYYDNNYDTCERCSPAEYSPAGEQSCLPCNNYSFSTGKKYNSANGIAGQSECPWMCDKGYYRGGTGFDECIQCTGSLHCSGTGLEYSNSVSNDIYCTGNTQIVYNDTTHTYSCESCSDSNASLDGTVCKCKEGYYGTLNGLNTTCTACPYGTTSTDGSTCQMTPDTQFCDANGENCMKLLSGATNIN